MKHLIQKIASKSKRNEELFQAVEAGLGRPLSWEEKVQSMQDQKRVVKAQKQLQQSTAQAAALTVIMSRKKFNSLWRYAATAFLSVAVCLSVVLPITLKDKYPTLPEAPAVIPPEQTAYTDFIPADLTEDFMRAIKGFLLPGEEDLYWIHSTVEFAAEDLVLLSYVINQAYVLSSEEELSWLTYRIRTYQNYAFVGYYEEYYATLEEAHKTFATILVAEDSYSVVKVYDPVSDIEEGNKETIKVDAFVFGGVAVFCFIDPSESANNAFIYFQYGGYEYFIELVEQDFKIDMEYIKNDFIKTMKPSGTPENTEKE